jgi:hypothetical protein
MSMYMTINTISVNDIEVVKSNEFKFNKYHFEEIFEEDLEDLNSNEKVEILNWNPESTREVFHVEASFAGIHYLLTGHKEMDAGEFPFNFLGENGTPLHEVGWGVANLYYREEVLQILNALIAKDDQELIKNYDELVFNQKEIYGGLWQENDGSRLVGIIHEMIEFLKETVNNKKGIYITIE